MKRQIETVVENARRIIGSKNYWSAEAPVGPGGRTLSFVGADLICYLHFTLTGPELDIKKAPSSVKGWYEKLNEHLLPYIPGEIYSPGCLLLRKPKNEERDTGNIAVVLSDEEIIMGIDSSHGPQIYHPYHIQFFDHVCTPENWFPLPEEYKRINHELIIENPFYEFVKDGVKICEVKRNTRGFRYGEIPPAIEVGNLVRFASIKNYSYPSYMKRVIAVHEFKNCDEALETLDISKIIPISGITIEIAKQIYRQFLTEDRLSDEIIMIEVQ